MTTAQATRTNPGGPLQPSTAPGIQVTNLSQWVQIELTNLLSTTDLSHFKATFNDFFAPDVDITLNGARLTREEYAKRLMQLGAVNEPGDGSQTHLKDIKFDGTVQTRSGDVSGYPVSSLIFVFLDDM